MIWGCLKVPFFISFCMVHTHSVTCFIIFDSTTFISSRPRTPKIHLRGERQVTRFVMNMEKSGYLQNKRQNNKAKQNDKTKKQ